MSFLVADTESVPILELVSCKNLKLIKCISIVESKDKSFPLSFQIVLGEIGAVNKVHHTEIKENLIPTVTSVRRIPHSLKPKVEKELKRMVDLHIIKPVDEPTD